MDNNSYIEIVILIVWIIEVQFTVAHKIFVV